MVNHIKKHGYDVTTEILYITTSKKDFKKISLYFSKLFNITESQNFANCIPETGEDGVSLPGKLNPFYGKHHSDETRKQWSNIRSKRPLSQYQKDAIGKSTKGKTYEERYGNNKAAKLKKDRENQILINNPMSNPKSVAKMRKTLSQGYYITPVGTFHNINDAAIEMRNKFNINISEARIFDYCKNCEKIINGHMIGNSQYLTQHMKNKSLKDAGFYFVKKH